MQTPADPLVAAHRAAAQTLAAVAVGLTPEEAAQPVPACPAWTVREVVAHVAGAHADLLSGRMEGAPGPRWSARHVGERAGLPLTVLADEILRAVAACPPEVYSSPAPTPVWDLVVHASDVGEALGRGPAPEVEWREVLERAVAFLASCAVPVGTVTTADSAWRLGRGPDVDLAAGDLEFFRVLFSRRSRRQVRALAGDAETFVGQVQFFGVRDDEPPR